MRPLLALVVVACSGGGKTTGTKPGECLDFHAAFRNFLTTDPAGNGLYWLEQTTVHDYESQATTTMNLVHYDLRTRRRRHVLDRIWGPLLFMRDKIIALRWLGNSYALMVIDKDRAQIITPDYLDVSDVEPIDDHRIAFLATGDGPRAVYTIDLDRQRPHHLIDGDRLLGIVDGRVLVEADHVGVAIDPVTGKRDSFAVEPGSMPRAGDLVFVDAKQVKARPFFETKTRTVLATELPWMIVHQQGSVLARTPPANELSHASLIMEDAKPLPTVHGGATILGTTTAGADTWAIVGHNTANYRGDPIETDPETDICLLPKESDVTFPTRVVPKRFEHLATKLFDAAGKAAPDVGIQVIEGGGGPTTMYFEEKAKGGADFAGMRARVRELHQRVTTVLGDREIKTEVAYADRRIALVRWRRVRLRKRTSVGMGDALIGDPSEFDVEIRDLVDERKGERFTCSGTLVNPHTRKLENLEIRCIDGDRQHVIKVRELAPSASHRFSETFEVPPGAAELFAVFKDGEPLEMRDVAYEDRMMKVFELASDIYAATEMSLLGHKIEKTMSVTVFAPGFEKLDETAQQEAAAQVHTRYGALRAIYDLDAKLPLTLRISIKLGSIGYEYDGKQLVTL